MGNLINIIEAAEKIDGVKMSELKTHAHEVQKENEMPVLIYSTGIEHALDEYHEHYNLSDAIEPRIMDMTLFDIEYMMDPMNLTDIFGMILNSSKKAYIPMIKTNRVIDLVIHWVQAGNKHLISELLNSALIVTKETTVPGSVILDMLTDVNRSQLVEDVFNGRVRLYVTEMNSEIFEIKKDNSKTKVNESIHTLMINGRRDGKVVVMLRKEQIEFTLNLDSRSIKDESLLAYWYFDLIEEDELLEKLVIRRCESRASE